MGGCVSKKKTSEGPGKNGRSLIRRRTTMKGKVLFVIATLSYAPLAFGANDAAYPSEKVAEFVVAKLDANSLPSVFRPKKEKGKRTFTDYGFTARRVEESEAIVEAPGGWRSLAIKVLDRKPSGIYVCVAEIGQNSSVPKTQSVLFPKRKDPNGLLKGRESFQEYAAWPVIGGSGATADSYGGY